MRLLRVVFVLVGVMSLFAGKLSAQQVKTDYDRSADFSQYKTPGKRSKHKTSWGSTALRRPSMPLGQSKVGRRCHRGATSQSWRSR